MLQKLNSYDINVAQFFCRQVFIISFQIFTSQSKNFLQANLHSGNLVPQFQHFLHLCLHKCFLLYILSKRDKCGKEFSTLSTFYEKLTSKWRIQTRFCKKNITCLNSKFSLCFDQLHLKVKIIDVFQRKNILNSKFWHISRAFSLI